VRVYSQEERKSKHVAVKNQIILLNQYVYKIPSILVLPTYIQELEWIPFPSAVTNQLQPRTAKLINNFDRSRPEVTAISILAGSFAARRRRRRGGRHQHGRRRRGVVGADGDVGERRQHAPDAHGAHGAEAEGPEPAVLGEDVGGAAEDEVDQPLDEHEHGHLGERVAELRRQRRERRPVHGVRGETLAR
jgi:hypothetical protein